MPNLFHAPEYNLLCDYCVKHNCSWHRRVCIQRCVHYRDRLQRIRSSHNRKGHTNTNPSLCPVPKETTKNAVEISPSMLVGISVVCPQTILLTRMSKLLCNNVTALYVSMNNMPSRHKPYGFIMLRQLCECSLPKRGPYGCEFATGIDKQHNDVLGFGLLP